MGASASSLLLGGVFSAQGYSLLLRSREHALRQARFEQLLHMLVEELFDPLPKAKKRFSDTAAIAVKALFYLLGTILGRAL